LSDITINGIKEVEQSMKALSGFPQQRQLIQAAGRRAARVYISAAKASIPRKTGELKRSIGTKSSRTTNSVIVGPRRGGKFKGYHGHLYEEGFTHRSGVKVQGAKTLQRAWDATKTKVRDVQMQVIGEKFNQYASKALKR